MTDISKLQPLDLQIEVACIETQRDARVAHLKARLIDPETKHVVYDFHWGHREFYSLSEGDSLNIHGFSGRIATFVGQWHTD